MGVYRISSVFVVLAGLALGGCFTETDPPASWFEGCGELDDCRTGTDACFDIRWTMGRGGMCSGICQDDVDCPGNSRCFELVGDPSATRICYQRCDSDRDCASGFVCIDAEMEGMVVDAICLPR